MESLFRIFRARLAELARLHGDSSFSPTTINPTTFHFSHAGALTQPLRAVQMHSSTRAVNQQLSISSCWHLILGSSGAKAGLFSTISFSYDVRPPAKSERLKECSPISGVMSEDAWAIAKSRAVSTCSCFFNQELLQSGMQS
ncbi:hypothetical protein BDP81DRAFT_120157 [Colletotrichum phormii]|uniref:Uncharacterized protein n=1 Tax=Colletotrichum phormii TaxID=359342 RepID=A0AAI9ZFL4_9PEZI|nr:uncharacterized protein BDP81DRAFT_120157 [Colletotrichum phormii]KAK1623644.1 hypothetical protein BDP81DRAFT_120157 [Colletotrichum phormii]